MVIDLESIKLFLPKQIYQIFEMNDLVINEEFKLQDNIFNSQYFILSLIKNPENIKLEKNKKTLNKLCKKIDVQKQLVELYSKDLSTTIDSPIVKNDILILLMVLYLYLAERNKNLKFLNTVLKMLEVKSNYPKFLYIWADSLVEELV